MPPASDQPDAATMQQLQTPRTPLRRATYIHVSDLTSAYNIDHKRLELELARVKSLLISDSPKSVQTSETLADEVSVSSHPQKRLQAPRGGFNLCVLVGKVNVVVDKFRVDRSRVRLAEVEVGDETGTVSLRARDDQIDVLQEVSKQSGAVVLRNCTLELFQGKHIRLAVTKWGKLSVFPDDVASTPPPPSKMNKERNFSLIDLSIVASEMAENQPDLGHLGANRESPIVGPQSRQPFQAPQYTQPIQQRRASRDRRQGRGGRGVGVNPLTGTFPEASMQNRMMYPAAPGFSYGDSMEIRQYYGGHIQNQDGSSPHHYMQLQQQYAMQHRQLHQMQVFHDQGDHSNQMRMHRNRASVPNTSGSRGFDSEPPDFPSLPVIVPDRSVNRPQEEGASELTGSASTKPEIGPWGGHHRIETEGDIIPNSPGMNPTANAFAPTYGNPPGGQSMHGVQYHGYNPYDQSRGPYAHQQHPVYSQRVVYVPVLGASSGQNIVPSDMESDQQSDQQKSAAPQEEFPP